MTERGSRLARVSALARQAANMKLPHVVLRTDDADWLVAETKRLQYELDMSDGVLRDMRRTIARLERKLGGEHG